MDTKAISFRLVSQSDESSYFGRVSRIRKGYAARFRLLLRQVRARRVEQGVGWLMANARRKSLSDGTTESQALASVYSDLASRPAFRRTNAWPKPDRFWCDAGLGGLARWLRAAGFVAFWKPDIDDPEVLRQTQKWSAVLLTTDSLLMERRLLRDGIIRSLWIPPTLHIPQQLALVFAEFGLSPGEPRCMSCGGELRQVDKQALKERIPPRTFRWLDEYFVCNECDQLFWRGTHWLNIQRELEKLK